MFNIKVYLLDSCTCLSFVHSFSVAYPVRGRRGRGWAGAYLSIIGRRRGFFFTSLTVSYLFTLISDVRLFIQIQNTLFIPGGNCFVTVAPCRHASEIYIYIYVCLREELSTLKYNK